MTLTLCWSSGCAKKGQYKWGSDSPKRRFPMSIFAREFFQAKLVKQPTGYSFSSRSQWKEVLIRKSCCEQSFSLSTVDIPMLTVSLTRKPLCIETDATSAVFINFRKEWLEITNKRKSTLLWIETDCFPNVTSINLRKESLRITQTISKGKESAKPNQWSIT